MILSIEFGSNIKIIEGTKKKNILVISKAATLNVSADIYNSGFMDVDLTAEAIKDAFTENKISTKKAVFVIDSESVIIRKIKLPLLKKESEIITMIMLELEQQVSADLNQYRVIYKIADAFEEDGYIKALYVVYCMPLNIYNQYKRLAKTLKLLLVKLEISNCINTLSEHSLKINDCSLDREDAYAFVGIDFQKITFCTVNKGINDFFRSCNVESGVESAAESKALYMNSYGTSDNMPLKWLEEINKCIRFYHSVYNSRINKIYIYGHFLSRWSMDKFLSLNLSIESEIINSLSDIVFNEKNFINEYFIPAIAMYDNKSMNFLFEDKGYIVPLRNIAVITAVFFCFSFFFFRRTAIRQREIEELGNFVTNEENIKKSLRIDKLKEENVILKQRINLIENAINAANDEFVHSELLREIFCLIPESTKVLSFSADKSSINMECESITVEDVIFLLTALKKIDLIEETDTTEIRSQQNSKYSYTVICKFKDVNLFE